MWWRRRKSEPTADALFARWFSPLVPEGHASLEVFEAAITDEERTRLPKTLAKLAREGVERIHEVRGHDLDPDRRGLVYLDTLLDEGLRVNLTRGQDPAFPRNLFRVVATEFGCIVGEIWVRTERAVWLPQRAPNLWRSRVRGRDGRTYDPFRAVVAKLSAEREASALVRDYDGFE